MNQRIWTFEEDKYIINNFGKVTLTEMAKELNCCITTIQRRASDLGFTIETKSRRRWTEDEVELLKEMAPKYLNKTIAKKLNLDPQEVNRKAKSLGLKLIFKEPIWDAAKEKYLKDNVNILSLSQIGEYLKVSYYQIADKMNELGLTCTDTRWTDEEISILTTLAPKIYYKEIAKVLNRGEDAVRTKAYHLDIEIITLKRKYTESELLYIKNNWGIIPVTEMARKLKVSRIMIQRQADLMNLPKLGNNPYRKWDQENIEKLRKLSKTKNIDELAKHFHTTKESICTVAHRNQIELIDQKIHWTEDDKKILKKYAETMKVEEIAIKMNRTIGAIRKQLDRLGISAVEEDNNRLWTEENNKELKRLVKEGKTLLEISSIMNKNDQTVLKKAQDMKLSIILDEMLPWTEEEKNKLKELSKTKKLTELVTDLGRTSASIKRQADLLNISLILNRRAWTEEEYQKLEQLIMVDKKTPKEVADILGRSEDSVIIKVSRRGLKVQTNDKRFWTKEEEILLMDLWGSESLEKIAKKLNRTESSVKNKVFQLGLGSQISNNFDGIIISEIANLFNINILTISILWISLGLKYRTRKLSQARSYRYVEINDLLEFLENHQNIWDSRHLEKNILGKEPDWLIEKRKADRCLPEDFYKKTNLMREQLIDSNLMQVDIEQLMVEEGIELQLGNDESQDNELKLARRKDDKK